MKQLILIVLSFQIAFLLLTFQNCAKGFNSLQNSDSASVTPSSSLQISVSDKSKFFAEAGKSYVVLVAGGAVTPALSTLRAVRGTCPANQSWGPLNKLNSPWTTGFNGSGVNFLEGANTWAYSLALDNEMGGCDWQGCVAGSSGASSCLEFITRCQPQTLHPYQPTCFLTGGGIGQNVCSATGKTFTCVTPPPPTCSSATQPASTTEQKTCASLLGASYSGNYTITHSSVCQGASWVSAPDTNNSATACMSQHCPQPQPSNTSTQGACSGRDPMYSGTFTQTTSYSCNTSFQWVASTSDNFASQCQPLFPKLSALPRNSNGDVEVPAGTTAFVDSNIDVSTLTVQGTLRCGGSTDNFELKAKTIIVNGTFTCGDQINAYAGKLTISLKANAAIQPRTGVELAGAAAVPGAINYRALIVNGNGKLILHGMNPGPYARLIATVSSGNSIMVSPTTGWKVGDEIAIAPTSYEATEAETFKIAAINGSAIQLSGNLQFKHWGASVDSYLTQRGVVELDQRAEVINLSRNIKIQADDPANQLKFFEENFQLGGHVMVMNGGFAQVDGVEFYKMGQAGMMARYPFHWHFVGNAPGQYIKNSSIHTSFQRCVTVHATNNTLVENNVCYQFRGHGYFLEDGNEVNNVLRGNIGMGAFAPFASKVLLASDNLPDGVGKRFPAVAVFWISNPQNSITNNIAAGSVGTGFWNSFEDAAVGLNTTDFSGNVAHSTLVGHTWDGAPNPAVSANNPNNPADRKLTNAHYRPSVIPVFGGLKAYKNSQAGIYFRGQTVVYDNAIVADNSWSFFLAYNQIVRNSTIIGRSNNNGPVEDAILQSTQQVGITMYDGPFELNNVDFLNFPTTANVINGVDMTHTPIFGIGGSEKLSNLTMSLRFAPQPRYKVMVRKFVDQWADEHLAQAIRDKDGTLTGTANALLLGSEDFSSLSTCAVNPAIMGMKVCPPATQMGTMRIVSTSYGGVFAVGLRQIWRRSDGVVSLGASDLAVMAQPPTDLYAKTTLVTSANFSYEMSFFDDFSNRNKNGDLTFVYYSENDVSVLSPVIKITGYGSQCRLNGAPQVGSVAALSSTASSAYFSSGNEFYLRMRAGGIYSPVVLGQTNSGQERNQATAMTISCDAAVASVITGVIDSVDSSGRVSGWACNYGSAAQIPIHLYVGGPAGSGTFVNDFPVALGSESAVNFACGDGSGTGHRFSFQVPSSIPASNYSGKKIYLHGINGADNSLLAGSGNFSFP